VTPQSRHGMWSSGWLFILAAAGSAVGLGNIWKFPYIAGENGGGAFVLVYLGCVALVGMPILAAEVLLGRAGRVSPINTMRALVRESRANPAWVLIGWSGALAGFLILSYYAVIAGWALYYIVRLGDGSFDGATAAFASDTFDAFLADPWQLMLWQTIFLGATVWIVARGVIKGLESAIRWFMPLLFLLLIVLLIYGVNSGGFAEGARFLLRPDWSEMSVDGFLVAMGQAFFTLSLGMGAMMAYGAYVPANASIGNTVITVALLDTAVAVAAGLAIFPVVFANGLEPGQGPGLMFVTIPFAFGQMPFGAVFGVAFFVLVTFAAITSAISLTEPALAYLVEEYDLKRSRAAIGLGAGCWLLGLGTVFSFNVWSDVDVVGGLTVFAFIDYLTQNIMLPLGGLLIALFVAFVLPRTISERELGIRSGMAATVWPVLIRFIAPLGVLLVFVYTLYQSLR
jgi:NSS family neurotransmitter:Na+ symporter